MGQRMPRLGWLIIVAISTWGLFVAPAEAAVTPDDPGNFITTWNTENAGTSNDDQITIPGTGGGYSYEIYWENTASSTMNGTTSLITTDSYTLTFPEPGIYEVQASGTFPRIYFNNSGDRQKILTVEQWGDMQWTSMSAAFRGAVNLRIPATDAPDLSGVSTMATMFQNATAFNDPIGHWDVSNVSAMSNMFREAVNFNQPLNSWDTSSLANVGGMFWNANSFDQPLNSWDVSNVGSFEFMFRRAASFNQPLNSWDVSGASKTNAMFWQASSFNQPLDNWDVSNVTNMGSMFNDSAFNQPIGNWDTSSSTNMEGMFLGTPYNHPLNDWDVSNVTTFFLMFGEGSEFNQPIGDWDTSSVQTMWRMFKNNQAFNQDISDWDTSSVTRMDQMFQDATAFDRSLANWDVSNVTTMARMFENAGVSQSRQDATLAAWAAQSVQSGVPLHIGVKTYGSTGAAAIDTLETDHSWTISEQYQAQYTAGTDASLVGDGSQIPFVAGATTTAVEVRPDERCEFIQWSDGETDNPRQDVLFDNVIVSAEVVCEDPPRGSQGVSASTRADNLERQGKIDEANALRERYASDDTSATIKETVAEVRRITERPLPPLDPVEDRAIIVQLIAVLMALVEQLTALLTQAE